jgi:hypothetical protein
MFSFFKNEISIRSVSIPDFGWPKVREEEAIIMWGNPERTAVVSINYFDLVPNIPTVRDVNVIRSFYRNLINEANGGLLAAELFKQQGFDVVKTIFKIPQQPRGMAYIGSLTLPFSTCSFVLKVHAVEAGMTGLREAMVADKLLRAGNFDMDNWDSDPYDKDLKTGVLMNLAEVENYDMDFPDHPLSRVRDLLTR